MKIEVAKEIVKKYSPRDVIVWATTYLDSARSFSTETSTTVDERTVVFRAGQLEATINMVVSVLRELAKTLDNNESPPSGLI